MSRDQRTASEPIVYLTAPDVRALLDIDALRGMLARALVALSDGTTSVPARVSANAPRGLVAAMPGYVPDIALELKAVTVFPGNHGTELPSHQGVIVMFDEHTGAPTAIMDAASITAIRTAVTASLAGDLLARRDATTLAIIGAGVQGHAHLDAFADRRAWREIRIASRNGAHAAALAARTPLGRVASFEDATRGADVVCLCTDASGPVIDARWLAPGAHVSSVGFHGELPIEAVDNGTVFVEWRGAATFAPPAGAAELQGVDAARLTEIGEVITGRHPGRQSPGELTVYKSTGHAVEDAAAARLVLDAAIASGTGLRLPP